jgi:hypothetical protein
LSIAVPNAPELVNFDVDALGAEELEELATTTATTAAATAAAPSVTHTTVAGGRLVICRRTRNQRASSPG